MVDKDQNITLKMAKAAISAMVVQGITTVTSYYSERLLPDEEMEEFARHISSLTSLVREGAYRVNTLLYYPFENLCALREPLGLCDGSFVKDERLHIGALVAELMRRQVCFDFINKRFLLSSELCDGGIRTPNGELIEYVVLPAISSLDGEVAEFLKEAKARGVKVIFDGDRREITDLSFDADFIGEGAYPSSELELDGENSYITAAQRAFDGYDLFMLLNTEDRDHRVDISIKAGEGERFALVDHLTGERVALTPAVVDGVAGLSLDLPATDLVIIGRFSANK